MPNSSLLKKLKLTGAVFLCGIALSACNSSSSNTYTLGGSVSYLGTSGQIILENTANHDTLTISKNGAFTFNQALGAYGSYNVVIKTQPTNQSCTVNNGIGQYITGNVTDIAVVCSLDLSSLYLFQGRNSGMNPQASLIQDANGNFYGTTESGGNSNNGTVFKIVTDGTSGGTTETVLYSFSGGVDGANPLASLIQGKDGNFYGTTESGGSSDNGTVFEIVTDGTLSGTTETVLHSFTGGVDGANPQASLIQDTNGVFYGTTSNGGSSIAEAGTVFTLSAS